MKKNPYRNIKVRKFIDGVLLEDLPEEKLKEFRRRNTEMAGAIIVRHVNNMINNGASEQEVVDFLKVGLVETN